MTLLIAAGQDRRRGQAARGDEEGRAQASADALSAGAARLPREELRRRARGHPAAPQGGPGQPARPAARAQIDYQLGSYAQAEAALRQGAAARAEADVRAPAAGPDVSARGQAGQGARGAEAAAAGRADRIRTRWRWPARSTCRTATSTAAARYFEKAATLDPKSTRQAHRRWRSRTSRRARASAGSANSRRPRPQTRASAPTWR